MDGHLSPGTLLLSAPEMLDPNFMHAVVLMIHHDDDGAMDDSAGPSTSSQNLSNPTRESALPT